MFDGPGVSNQQLEFYDIEEEDKKIIKRTRTTSQEEIVDTKVEKLSINNDPNDFIILDGDRSRINKGS